MVKERGRDMLNTLPFGEVTKRVIIELFYLTALWLNAFPENRGISKVYSPREIISGHKLDFRLHRRMDFGDYAEVQDDPSPTNSMISRTRKYLGIVPTGNIQG